MNTIAPNICQAEVGLIITLVKKGIGIEAVQEEQKVQNNQTERESQWEIEPEIEQENQWEIELETRRESKNDLITPITENP